MLLLNYICLLSRPGSPNVVCVSVSQSIMYGVSQKKWDLKKHGHNYSEIRQKKKKLVCFGKFSLNAAGLASNLSKLVEKWLRKMNMKLVTPL